MSGLGHLFATPITEAGRRAGQIADEAIDLYLEYVQEHGYDEESARLAAVREIEEGHSVDERQVAQEMEAARVELAVGSLPSDLPL